MDGLVEVEMDQPTESVPAVEAALPPGQGALVRQLADQVRAGRLHPRLAVALITRMVPQQRAPQPCLAQPLDLPPVVDASTYAEAVRRILAAVAAGHLASHEGERLTRMAKAAHLATVAAMRARHRLRG
jgi:hypothetical protein